MNDTVFRKILLGLLTAVAVIGLLSIIRVGFAFWLYSYIGQWATTRLGLDYYESELLTVVLTSAVMFLVPGLGGFFFSRKKRLIHAGLIIGAYLLVCGLVFTLGRNVYFDRVSGQPLRYYIDLPNGTREFSFTEGFHPRYGLPYKPYTQEVVQEDLRRQRSEAETIRKREEMARKTQEIEQKKREDAERQRLEWEQKQQGDREKREYELAKAKQEQEQREQELRQQQQQFEQERLATEQRSLEEQRRHEREVAIRQQEEQVAIEREREAEARRQEQERERLEREAEAKRQRDARRNQIINNSIRKAEELLRPRP